MIATSRLNTNIIASLPPIAGNPDGTTVMNAWGPSTNFFCISGSLNCAGSGQFGTVYMPGGVDFRAARIASSSDVLRQSVLCQGMNIQMIAPAANVITAVARIGCQSVMMVMATPFLLLPKV